MVKEEIWKDIKGCEGSYQVSSMGRVRSLDRTTINKNGNKMFFKGRILAESFDKDGYTKFNLRINGKYKTFPLAQLVAVVFLGHKPDGHKKVIDHINGIKTDNRVCNLRIVSNRENTSSCFRKDRGSFSSKYVGVHWSKNDNKWRSSIYYKDKTFYLGSYDDELEASQAYQNALDRINSGTFKAH